jgi:hypothetical protein
VVFEGVICRNIGVRIEGNKQPKQLKMLTRKLISETLLESARRATVSTTSTTAKRGFSHALNNHRDTPYNNAKTPFDFTVENYKRVDAILAKYPTHYKQR